jgi:hypothetical protein
VIDFDAFPSVAQEKARRIPELERYYRWLAHRDAVDAENSRRLADYEVALAAAGESGDQTPEKPALLEIASEPHNPHSFEALRRMKVAVVNDAPAIREALDHALAELEQEGAPWRQRLAALELRQQALIQQRHQVDVAEREIYGVALLDQPHNAPSSKPDAITATNILNLPLGHDAGYASVEAAAVVRSIEAENARAYADIDN